MRTETTFLKKALPGGCKSWQRPVHLNRGLSEKKTQRPPKIIGRTEQEKTNYTSHFSVHFFAFFCTITKRKSLGKNKCQHIFLWSTSRMLSHKYVVSFLSSFSELLLVSRGLFTWYRNDFHSGMSFVPEWSSYCIHKNRMAQPLGVLARVAFSRQIRYKCATRPRLARFAIFSPERSLFSAYMIPE